MSQQDVKCGKVSRRQFLWVCTSASVVVCIFVNFIGCQSGSDISQFSVGYKYKPIANWPDVPKSFISENVTGIATDSTGRIYAAGGKENAVLVFSPDGTYIGSWGKPVVGKKHGLRIFGDRLWVTDTGHHQLHEFTLEGKLLRSLGTKDKAGVGQNEFNRPTDIALAPNGDMYISDGYGNSRIVCLAPDGSFKMTWGKEGDRPGEFNKPHNIIVDAKGRVYVADRANMRIQVFSPEGKFLNQYRNVGKPFGLYITPEQTLFVTDGDGNRILVLDLNGKILVTFGEPGEGPGQFKVPHSIHVDENNNIYIAEAGNQRIQKFVPRL